MLECGTSDLVSCGSSKGTKTPSIHSHTTKHFRKNTILGVKDNAEVCSDQPNGVAIILLEY